METRRACGTRRKMLPSQPYSSNDPSRICQEISVVEAAKKGRASAVGNVDECDFLGEVEPELGERKRVGKWAVKKVGSPQPFGLELF